MKIGFGITSSFCTLKQILINLQELVDCGYDVYPVISPNIKEYDTRFGTSDYYIDLIEKITGKKVIDNIVDAEPFGPSNKMDIMVVAPATGNFLAKMANGITDNPVNLAVKATLRNEKPIVLAISTNDGLSANGKNIMELYNRKNIFLVPFGQDNYEKKPNSLISHYDMLLTTIYSALDSKQIQPVIKNYTLKNKKI